MAKNAAAKPAEAKEEQGERVGVGLVIESAIRYSVLFGALIATVYATGWFLDYLLESELGVAYVAVSHEAAICVALPIFMWASVAIFVARIVILFPAPNTIRCLVWLVLFSAIAYALSRGFVNRKHPSSCWSA